MALGITKKNNVSVASAMDCPYNNVITWVSTAETPINAGATEMYIDCMLQVAITFHATSTLDAEVHLRYSADDGTTKDTEDVGTYAMTIPYASGTVTKSLRVPSFDYLDVGIKNVETAGAYTNVANIDFTGMLLTGLT